MEHARPPIRREVASLVVGASLPTGCTTEASPPAPLSDMGEGEAGCLVRHGDDRHVVGPLGPSDTVTITPDELLAIRFGRTAADLVVNAERERQQAISSTSLAELPSSGDGRELVRWPMQDGGNPGVVVRCWRGGEPTS